MASIQSLIYYQYKKTIHRKGKVRGNAREAVPPESLYKKHVTEARLVEGRPVYCIDFHKTGELPCILYVHGGSFSKGLRKKDWKLLSALLKSTGCPVAALDFPLIPEHSCKGILSWCMEALTALSPECPRGFLLMGDSAGASIAMAMAQQAKEKGLSLPSAILLLCPFLDATGNNPAKNVLAPRDPVLDQDKGRETALLYAGSLPLEDPRVSPVFGDMKGLPRVYAWTGDNDILYADALLLKEKLRDAHVPYHIYVYPGMTHNWMYECLPEARTALRQIISEVRNLADFPGK